MGYRDDFFTPANIIGITGPVNELPSVYFKDVATGEFGHITQVHGSDWNWGRTEVRVDAGWVVTNTCPGPPQCACGRNTNHEINGRGVVFHKSRSTFTASGAMSAADLEVAAEAIPRCPYMKTDPRTRLVRDEQQRRYGQLWVDRHAKLEGGRRGAIDYTGEGLANHALGIVYPGRL